MYKNLVFSGGAIQGLSFIGCLQCLEELDIIKSVETYCGTSIGALFATLIYLGYNSLQLYQLMINIKIEEFQNFDPDTILSFLSTFGFDDGTKITKLIKIFIDKKIGNPDITFIEAHKIIQKKLIIVGTNVYKQEPVYFSYETTPNMKIYEAIRISIGIPFLFTAYYLDNQPYADGAVISNYCMELFKDQLDNTLGFIVKVNKSNQKIDNILKYIYSVFKSYRIQLNRLVINTYKKHSIILEDIEDVNMMNFKITDDHKIALYNTGYRSTHQYFHKKKYHKILTKINLDKIQKQ